MKKLKKYNNLYTMYRQKAGSYITGGTNIDFWEAY